MALLVVPRAQQTVQATATVCTLTTTCQATSNRMPQLFNSALALAQALVVRPSAAQVQMRITTLTITMDQARARRAPNNRIPFSPAQTSLTSEATRALALQAESALATPVASTRAQAIRRA